ncbi:MAG: hypothetical protein BWY89_00470 [Bacteroidetes bacterium ADurb.BinA012]|nr:MAG: hypothetical protein BWY89_00470 [Bacteroidetes bacterium ADurb.BinA012]
MHLTHDVHPGSQCNAYGNLQRITVNRERRSVIYLVCAGRFIVNTVGDLLPGSELHERSAVIDSHLTESRSHVTDHLRVKIIVIMVNTGRTTTKELVSGQQLLVHLEARLKTNPLIIIKRRLFTGNIPDLLTGLFVVLPRINY